MNWRGLRLRCWYLHGCLLHRLLDQGGGDGGGKGRQARHSCEPREIEKARRRRQTREVEARESRYRWRRRGAALVVGRDGRWRGDAEAAQKRGEVRHQSSRSCAWGRKGKKGHARLRNCFFLLLLRLCLLRLGGCGRLRRLASGRGAGPLRRHRLHARAEGLEVQLGQAGREADGVGRRRARRMGRGRLLPARCLPGAGALCVGEAGRRRRRRLPLRNPPSPARPAPSPWVLLRAGLSMAPADGRGDLLAPGPALDASAAPARRRRLLDGWLRGGALRGREGDRNARGLWQIKNERIGAVDV